MPWELLDHQADVGLQATGPTLAIALADGVRGMLGLMVDPTTVQPRHTFAVDASGSDPGSLYVDLLNAVLAAKDIHNVFFHDIEIDTLEEHDDGWHVSCRLYGEPIDLERHAVDSDVKAATYGGLRVQQDDQGWLLRCVLDL
jgi:SHS2 domain-containing protein